MRSVSGFSGVYPMTYALFGSDGKLSRDAMRTQVKSMLAHGVHGVAILGMATEVNKLSTAERRMLMEWAAEDIAGKVPLSVTVAESNVEGQVEFVRAAKEVGRGLGHPAATTRPQCAGAGTHPLLRGRRGPVRHSGRDPECARIYRHRHHQSGVQERSTGPTRT